MLWDGVSTYFLPAQRICQSPSPIALVRWKVNFLADTNVANLGVSNIVLPHGLTADATYTRGNLPPGAMAPPVALGNINWH